MYENKKAIQEYNRRKWEFINDAIDSADKYGLALGRIFAELGGIRKDYPNAKTIKETKDDEDLKKYDSELIDAGLQRSSAYSRLKVVGEASAAVCIEKLHKLEDEIRDCAIFRDELPSIKKLDEWYSRFQESRDEFLKELGQEHPE